MKASTLIQKAKDSLKVKTLYVRGCFGAPLVGANVERYMKNHPYNRRYDRSKMIMSAGNQKPPVFGFDCVCFIKGLLWGWNGNASLTYGGAKYGVNGVPDVNADTMITLCKDVSKNFSSIMPGEAMYRKGHIGIYIGNGLTIECTPQWSNGVLISSLPGFSNSYPKREWLSHGKMPWVEYDLHETMTTPPATHNAFLITSANLHLRVDAGQQYKSLVVMPKGSKVMFDGKTKLAAGVRWYHVYYHGEWGWSSSRYLR